MLEARYAELWGTPDAAPRISGMVIGRLARSMASTRARRLDV